MANASKLKTLKDISKRLESTWQAADAGGYSFLCHLIEISLRETMNEIEALKKSAREPAAASPSRSRADLLH